METKDLLTSTGRVNSALVKEKNFLSRYPMEYAMIIEHSNNIGIFLRPFPEKLFHYLNNINDPILCKNCNSKIPKFQGIVNGYLDYCSSKCSNSSIEVMNEKKKSCIEKYGVDNPSKNRDIVKKINDTFIKNHGDNPFKLDKFKDKIRKTCIEKYGANTPLSKNSSFRIEKNIIEKNNFIKKYQDFDVVYYNPKKWGEARLICKKCNNEFEISKWNLHQRYSAGINPCTICNPIGSDTETFLESFIKEFLFANNIIFEEKTRKILGNGKELDFYIPSMHIAIETNGIFWHSARFKSEYYHKEKTELCLEKNIKLIHIFEDEIFKKPDIVKSRLSSIFSKIDKKIFARKCILKEVKSLESNEFLNKSHLQGECGASVRLGLYFNNELVSLMTFGKNRKSLGCNHKDGEYELIRFCNKLNTNIIGAASKLIKYFIENYSPKKITSFCDRRWSPEGEFYKKMGFSFVYNTKPNYWYYKNNSYERKHRFGFRKNVLVKKGFDINKTEFEIMEELNYIRIYDAGSSKWEMIL